MTTEKGGQKSIEQRLTNEDYAKIEMMGKFKASYQTVADELGIGLNTVEKKMMGDTRFRRCYKKGLSKMKLKLSEAQVKTAIEDRNPTMLVWLGKQYLGQTDKQSQELSGEVKITRRLFDDFLEKKQK